MHAQSLQSCSTLCDPWTVAHQAPLSTEFFRHEYWSGLPIPSPRDLPNPGIEPVSLTSPALAGGLFTTAAAKSLQSCPTPCDPIDGSPPCCPILGILQARTLEWVAISFSSAWKWKVKVKSHSRVRLSGSSAHGIFQAREVYRIDTYSAKLKKKNYLKSKKKVHNLGENIFNAFNQPCLSTLKGRKNIDYHSIEK